MKDTRSVSQGCPYHRQFSELCEVRQVEGGISDVQDGKQVLLRFSETDAEIIMLRGNSALNVEIYLD